MDTVRRCDLNCHTAYTAANSVVVASVMVYMKSTTVVVVAAVIAVGQVME